MTDNTKEGTFSPPLMSVFMRSVILLAKPSRPDTSYTLPPSPMWAVWSVLAFWLPRSE